jgi:hypothetical protein
MKKIIFSFLIILCTISASGQPGRTDRPEYGVQSGNQDGAVTATLKMSTRLFGSKDDLTTVIYIIPSGSVVTILGSDDTYYHVAFEEDEGYIFKRHAEIDKPKAAEQPVNQPQYQQSQPNRQNQQYQQNQQNQTDRQYQQNQQNQQNQSGRQYQQDQRGGRSQEMSRFSYLENKYGTSMASRLVSGKIWRGMTTEMVKDSWGNARKINRVISGNTVKEEWVFSNAWLYFENDELLEWGPVR